MLSQKFHILNCPPLLAHCGFFFVPSAEVSIEMLLNERICVISKRFFQEDCLDTEDWLPQLNKNTQNNWRQDNSRFSSSLRLKVNVFYRLKLLLTRVEIFYGVGIFYKFLFNLKTFFWHCRHVKAKLSSIISSLNIYFKLGSFLSNVRRPVFLG